MIHLTRLNHTPLVLNSDLIEQIEETPDTVITLTTRQIVRVREPVAEVLRRIVIFRRSVMTAAADGDGGIASRAKPEDGHSLLDVARGGAA